MSTKAIEVVPYSGEDADMRKTPRVRVGLDMDRATAEALAAAVIARDGAALYVADCRPVATAIADALVAAGMGVS
jgi:hypothetical protein